VARAESTYCFPAEIAHGAVQDCLAKGADFVLLPHFRDMPSYEEKVHANFCPITQALPYYIGKAFPDVDKKKWLPLVVSFKFGEEKALVLLNVLKKTTIEMINNHQKIIEITTELREHFLK
jgi:predicted nucleotide-binding protein (sugar kinase/HSP70/actin superfamily)